MKIDITDYSDAELSSNSRNSTAVLSAGIGYPALMRQTITQKGENEINVLVVRR